MKVSKWKNLVLYDEKNKDWLDKSFNIALSIILRLEDLNKTKEWLSNQSGICNGEVNYILKGRENLTLETISKIEAVLGISLVNVVDYDEQKGIE